MAAIADDLNTIVVTATAPDGRIMGRMESLEFITLRFLHDSYEQYYRHRDPETLAHQLGRGATLMATAYQKARREVMRAHSFERYTAVNPPSEPRHREYLERGAELTARGSSPEGEIQVNSVGLVEFRVTVAPEALERNDERGFLRLAGAALESLRASHGRAHGELRHELHLKYRDRHR
jgi:hypothetical protein